MPLTVSVPKEGCETVPVVSQSRALNGVRKLGSLKGGRLGRGKRVFLAAFVSEKEF